MSVLLYSEPMDEYLILFFTEKFKKLKFSKQQIKVALYILDGLCSKEISNLLGITLGTVKQHITLIYKITDITDRNVFITHFYKLAFNNLKNEKPSVVRTPTLTLGLNK